MEYYNQKCACPHKFPRSLGIGFRYWTECRVSLEGKSWLQCEFIEERSGRGRDIHNDEILTCCARVISEQLSTGKSMETAATTPWTCAEISWANSRQSVGRLFVLSLISVIG